MPKLLLTVCFCGFFTAPALADAIDGHWCATDGRQIIIAGRAVTTPSGAKIEGDYGRHSFSYVAPAAEPEAGQVVHMQLAGDTRVYIQVEGASAPVQLWRRCEEIS